MRLEETTPNGLAHAAADMTIDSPAPTAAAVITKGQSSAHAIGFDESAKAVKESIETLAPGGIVTVDAVVTGSGAQRIAVVKEMQRWASAGSGTFIVGRRGRPSRFIKAGPLSGGQPTGNSEEVRI